MQNHFSSAGIDVSSLFNDNGLTRNTLTYRVEGFLAADQNSLRNHIFYRYSDFYRKLLLSPSREVQFLASIVVSDSRSTTCSNLKYLPKKASMSQSQLGHGGSTFRQARSRSRAVEVVTYQTYAKP